MRALLKAIAHEVATAIVVPALISYRIRSAVIGRDRALEGSTQALAIVPGLLGQYLRRAFLARVLAGCHRSAVIGFGTIFSQADARIDENVYVGPRCHLGLVHVGRHTIVGAGAVVTRPLPDRVVAAGVPARVVRTRGDNRSSAYYHGRLAR